MAHRSRYNGVVEAEMGGPAVIYDEVFLAHDTGEHPECAARLVRTLAVLQETGLLDGLEVLSPRPAPREWIETVHRPAYVRAVESLCATGGGAFDLDTPVSARSFEAALAAAGAGLLAVDLLCASPARPSFALVRPPGHHAEPAEALGFCLFNNIAIATHYALRRHGAERVLIVDYDVHHGNGTQHAFYEDGRVLYFSVHQWPLYPGSGTPEETGVGAGEGRIINVPLPHGTGDEGYLEVFGRVLVPAARRFQPDLILVSAGYDAHWRDPLANMSLSVAGYAALATVVKGLAAELCQGRLAFFLEGGYDLDALAYGVAATLDVLLGLPAADPLGPSPYRSRRQGALQAIAVACRIHGL